MNIIKKYDRTAIYQWIVSDKIAHDGVAPTIREIMAGTGVKSSSHMIAIVDELERDGLIHVTKGRSRSITLAGNNPIKRLRDLLQKVYGEALSEDGGRCFLSRETIAEIAHTIDTVEQRP